MDELKEIFESVSARIRSPFFGYFLFSWAILNWKSWFFLLFSSAQIAERFAFFDDNTSPASLFWLPLVVGFALAIGSPWVRWFFVRAAQHPTTQKNLVQVDAESKILERKAERAAARASLKSVEEESLIAEAERDQKILAIEDKDARQKLQAQIDELRKRMNEPATWGSTGGGERVDESTSLRLDLVKEGKGYKFKLINIGKAEAINIQFNLSNLGDDGNPIPKSEYEKFPIPMLSPGGSVSLIAAIVMGSPTSYTADVSWESPGGKVTKKELFASL